MAREAAAISSHPSRVISRGVTSSRSLSRGLLPPPPPLPPRCELMPVPDSPTDLYDYFVRLFIKPRRSLLRFPWSVL